MRHNETFGFDDETELRRLIRENPWVTIVSTTAAGATVASHYPVILDESEAALAAGGVTILGHVGRPDDELHELGRHEVLVIVQGPHGYVSPGWYDANPAVPTWNFFAAHLSGTPELLAPEENYAALGRLVDFFEDPLPEPRRMEESPANAAYAQRIVSGTVGFRMRVDRFIGKRKMSQNKPAETVERVIAELEGDGPYASPALGREMRLARDAAAGSAEGAIA